MIVALLNQKGGVIGLPRETLHVEVPDIAHGADHVVIDGPPRVTALAQSAILAADLVLIPPEGLPALAADIHQRVVFAESVATGRLARELEPDGTAAREIAAVTAEIARGIP